MKYGILILFLLLNQFGFSQTTNVALHKPVVATSEEDGFPASNIVDGIISRNSKWVAANGKAPHIVEMDLQKYYTISEIKVHSGIMDSEKKPDEMTQASGFWSLKNFKMQYWDDANWSDFPGSEVHENRLTMVDFKYQPGITTFKIRLVCDDGDAISIMEIEALGTLTPNMPEPPTFASTIKKQFISTEPQNATIKVGDKIVGKSMKYVGYNQGYYLPESNISGWVEYSQVNAFRIWATLNSFAPKSAVQVDKNVTTVEEFDKRKNELRKSPENNAFLKWKELLPLYSRMDTSSTNGMEMDYALTELKRLGVDVELQINSTDFKDNWENKWMQWQRYYALAYYTAKIGDVTMFATQNEPNHRNSGPMKLDDWIMAMQIVSDAVHSAVEDVNKKYGKHLVGKFVGPVTAGNNPEWWAAVAKNIRIDYHGKTVDRDQLDIFSTHSYNSPAVGYEHRIDNIRKILQDNHPAGKSLPIVYTEIGRWMNAYLIDKEETMDSPSLFTEWAGIYSNNMKNGGYGMWAFKFANTTSDVYKRGVKSGHHFIWQGRRIVEDAYKNIALNKPVTTSNQSSSTPFITDGIKTDASTWISDSTDTQKWIEINLGKVQDIGSAVIYTGIDGGTYTSPEYISNLKLQYWTGKDWKDIRGTPETKNKYAQLFDIFKQPVSTDKVRFVSDDPGRIKVREIKLFAKGDGPSDKTDFDVSGIQRTGEVVRLFAKGFKDERPLMETKASVTDNDFDCYTSFDEKSGNYYMWLVQRNLFDYHLKLDFSKLDIAVGSPITAEMVSPDYYGEVTKLMPLSADKMVQFTLPAQSVVLLTMPKNKVHEQSVNATFAATVSPDKSISTNNSKELMVQLDAAIPTKNKVTYLWFDLSKTNISDIQKVVLKVNGYTDKTSSPFRLHVYGIPSEKWGSILTNWSSAPLLNDKEALIEEVGRKAFVAGEIAFENKQQDHMLDVTELVKKHAGKRITFVLVRETRQLGDDEDKGKKVMINNTDKNKKPELIIWNKK